MSPSPARTDLRAGDLVAAIAVPDPAFVRLVGEVWDRGAALFPVDPRLAPPKRQELLGRAQPTVLAEGDERRRLSGGRPVEAGLALVIATWGTTGRPKLVELARPAVEAAVAASLQVLGAGPADRWLCCLPVAHVGGLLVVLRSRLGGSPLALHPSFDPAAVAGEPDVAFVSVVPTMVGRLLAAGADLSRFRALLVGGSALDPALAHRAAEAGARLVVTYGLTESCGGVVYDGRPLEGVGLRLGVDGEVELAGPTLFRRYRDDPAATRRALGPDGWLRTGDAGALGPDGRLQVRGRLDDLILTGGEKVWPSEVEAVLAAHPEVAEVMVVGRPDPEWGQRVVAFVVPRRPGSPPTLAALRDLVGARLARYQAPAELVLAERLPRRPKGGVTM